jgi:hypothetical protein
MSKLTTEERKNLPTSTFAVPSQRAYPIPDEGHAKAALSRVAANGTPGEKAEVRSAVRNKFKSMTLKRKGK